MVVCFFYLSITDFSSFNKRISWVLAFSVCNKITQIVSHEHLLGEKLGLFRSRRKSLGCSGLCSVWVAWFVRSPPPGGHMGLADPGIHRTESVCFLRFWLHFVFIEHIHFSYIAYSENAAKTVRHLPSKTTSYPASHIYSRAFSWLSIYTFELKRNIHTQWREGVVFHQ